jgi:hypothetical protein
VFSVFSVVQMLLKSDFTTENTEDTEDCNDLGLRGWIGLVGGVRIRSSVDPCGVLEVSYNVRSGSSVVPRGVESTDFC